eukprot:TRINITY_DN101495_c0_g1_i1.p1 TRINITY_DN101495_c0_g1~~TRINITY_DN101495_c0_g1_i1.p1  ORF type:complete len:1022 (+),score=323.68 TRINITY_DN101495_c0_g1_i1:186-3251(+)
MRLQPLVCLLAALQAAAVNLRSRAASWSLGHGGRDQGEALHARELTGRSSVRKPLTDKREYAQTTFDSGLRVLTVRDPEAEKAAFAVAVDAGSLEDPADFQGLAHFCEHMLFLGSKKYPDEDAFSKHLALYDGNHNAYTSAEQTVYYNEVGLAGLEEGLDIFAQFFVSPSFAGNMVDKEIHAVDSEHMKYKPDTQRRLWHLLWSIGNPKNPSHQFATGDLETLKTKPAEEGKDLVKALKEFHAKNYCVRRLTLVLVMNKTTEEQLELAHKHFDGLPKATAESCPPRPSYTNQPAFSKDLGNLGRRLSMTTPGSPQLWLMFPMPDLKKNYKAQAEAYLWHTLGNYDKGSLKALLMEEDLSHTFSYSSHSTVAGSAAIITFALTEKGAKNPNAIMEHFFAYLAIAKEAGVDAAIIENMKQMRQVSWDYQEQQTSAFQFVSTLAGNAPNYQEEDVLAGGYLIDDVNVELTQKVLEHVRPDNMNVALVLPGFDKKAANAHEQYYDFDYENVALEQSLIDRLKGVKDKRLRAAPDMAYVPRKLDLIKEGAGEDGPEQLVKEGRLQLWWLGMGEAKLPKAIIQLKIAYSPKIIGSVQGSILAGMHSRLVQQSLEQSADGLLTCGVSYSVSPSTDGFGVSFTGFDEHIMELVKLVLPAIRKPAYTEATFEQLRRQLLLDVSDVTRSEPYQHALEAFNVVTVNGFFSRRELIDTTASTDLVNPAAHEKFLQELFTDAELVVLFTGNIDRTRAQDMTKTMEGLLQIGRKQSNVEHKGHLQVLKPKEDIEVRIDNPIQEDPNSATLVTYQFGVPTIADRIHLSMLNSIINRPVFEALRTQEQLGYVVFGNVAPHISIVEVRIIVQGFRKDPDAVEMLIEETVQNLTHTIANMSQEEFDMRKHSLDVELSKKDLTMSAEAGRYWAQIWDGINCFQKTKMQLDYLNSAEFNSPAPLLAAWKKAVEPGAARKRVAVKLFGKAAKQNATASLVNREDHASKKVLTLVDSSTVKQALQGEGQWPDDYICKAAGPGF